MMGSLTWAQTPPQTPSCEDYLATLSSQRAETETLLAHKEARLRQEFRAAMAAKDKEITDLKKQLEEKK